MQSRLVARQGAQVGFVSALACQVVPEPPRVEAVDRYVATPSSPSLTDSLFSGHGNKVVTVLAYKKGSSSRSVAS